MSSPAIILNESQPIQSAEEVRFLLASVFRGEVVPAFLLDAALALWKESPELKHAELLRQVRKTALAKPRRPSKPPRPSFWQRLLGKPATDISIESPDPERARLDQRFTEHFAEAKRASTAYAAKEKPVPSAVFWPNPSQTGERASSLFDVIPVVHRKPLLTKTTPIGSAGSCFAMEIAHWLQDNGFNYLVTEPPGPCDPHTRPMSNARWGIVFNTPSLRQLVERAFGVIETPRLLWSDVRNGVERFYDPFREDVLFGSKAEYEETYDSHVAAVRRALSEVKVFAMTLGMNEVWFLKNGGHALSRAPWRVASSCVEPRVLTVEENVQHLSAMWSTWKKFNPDVRLIITVSPVPLHATFRGDTQHVVVANAHSKAVLRAAAEQFVSTHDDVDYFPAYEVVMHCTRDAWDTDQRHVSRNTVKNVMRTFCEMFVDPQDLPPSEQELRSTVAHDLLNPGS